ncbi:hypothetical protein QRD43_20490 [Pelomonas sp. APW6]|uniref:Uncharacterized protein n=1 Tax=Roseateles subflavus TaxID=3053353 RepID=A0ABT7LN51_9BURK|nr:hypothetical protein [Pelomonas sp. APW6]MDL5034292.1 hypothetical protein [Pelomonas sp. APW6]
MALAKRSNNGGNNIFVDIKGNTGEIVRKLEGGGVETYDSLDGTVTGVDVRSNTYKGEEIHSLRMKIEDGSDTKIFASVGLGSFFAGKIVGLLNAADLSKPITLNVGQMKAGETVGDRVVEKDTTWVTAWQDGKRLTPDFGNGATELPKANKVVVSGKEMNDMTPVNEKVAELIGGLIDKLHPEAGPSDDHEQVDVDAAAGAAQRMAA